MVTLLCDDPSNAMTQRLTAIIDLLGVRHAELAVSALDAALEQSDTSMCLVSHADTLCRWWRGHGETNRALRQLQDRCNTLFVFGFEPEKNCVALASALSGGNITQIKRFEAQQQNYEVASSRPELTREFSGLSFGPICRDHDFGFVCKSEDQQSQIISIAGVPFFASIESAGSTKYLLACNAVLDIDERTGTLGPDVTQCFSRLIPFAMFLKWRFGTQCWHNPNRCAAFIIDDPLLKESHGFLNYNDLLALMDANNFSTTIAFIPWNYKRSRSAVARMFRQRADKFSLCIHGCDHSQAEFATSNVGDLNYKVRLATSRMDVHRKTTGVRHAQALVFPRGEFSPEALEVLQANDYLAAVNTRAINTVGRGRNLRVRDFLDVANTSYAGVSLFLRRYPGPLERFAWDLFWGKPVLAVEHHGYLRDGGSGLSSFIGRLNSLGDLQWSGLDDV